MTLISELIYGIIYIFSSLCYSVWHMVIIPVAFLGNDGLSCPSAQKEELDWLGLFLFDRWHHWQTENIQGKCQRPNWKHGANTVHLRWMITEGDSCPDPTVLATWPNKKKCAWNDVCETCSSTVNWSTDADKLIWWRSRRSLDWHVVPCSFD